MNLFVNVDVTIFNDNNTSTLIRKAFTIPWNGADVVGSIRNEDAFT